MPGNHPEAKRVEYFSVFQSQLDEMQSDFSFMQQAHDKDTFEIKQEIAQTQSSIKMFGCSVIMLLMALLVVITSVALTWSMIGSVLCK